MLDANLVPIIENIDWFPIEKLDCKNNKCNYIVKINSKHFYNKIEENYQRILSTDELTKAGKFRKIDDQRSFITGRFCLRHILSLFLEVKPQDIVFKLRENKKPYVDGIEFNASHSGDLVLLAFSQNPVGVDVEFISNDFEFNSIIDYSFSNQEKTLIQNSKDKPSKFYALWTRKEALLKATGEGLIDEINELSVLENTVVRLGKHYHFSSFKINQEYMACFVSSIRKHILYYDYS